MRRGFWPRFMFLLCFSWLYSSSPAQTQQAVPQQVNVLATEDRIDYPRIEELRKLKRQLLDPDPRVAASALREQIRKGGAPAQRAAGTFRGKRITGSEEIQTKWRKLPAQYGLEPRLLLKRSTSLSKLAVQEQTAETRIPVFLRLERLPFNDELLWLLEKGVSPVSCVQGMVCLSLAPPDQLESILNAGWITAIYDLEPNEKYSPHIFQEEKIHIIIVHPLGFPRSEYEAELKAQGALDVEYFAVTNRFYARASSSVAIKFAKLPWVGWIEPAPTAMLHQTITTSPADFEPDDSRELIGADAVWPQFLGAVAVGIIDTGIDNTHAAFPQGSILSSDADQDGHGTHVSGIVAARGSNAESIGGRFGARGVAPGSQIRVRELVKLSLDRTLDANNTFFQQSDIRVINNSWGDCSVFACPDPDFGYNGSAQSVDQWMDDQDLLLVFSAGNEAQSSAITAPATCKNCISVGAIEYTVSSSNGVGVLAGYSSRGPTRDGRLKPDLVAPGGAWNWQYGVVSANRSGTFSSNDWPSNSAYTRKSGTSMAAPHVTGVAALMQESLPQLRNMGQLNSNDFKAWMIATTIPLKNDSAQGSELSGFGSVNTGYGLVNALSATGLDFSQEASVLLWARGTVDENNTSQIHSFVVPQSVRQISAVLAYNDEQGTGVCVPDTVPGNLIDEVNLQLSGPGGLFSYQLPPGVTTKSPLQKIIVRGSPFGTPVAQGNWTATVQLLNFPGCLATGFTMQTYTLLIYAVNAVPSLAFDPNTQLGSSSSPTFSVVPGGTVSVDVSAVNSGGYIAAGVWAEFTGANMDLFSGPKKKFIGNLTRGGDRKSATFSFVAPTTPGTYTGQVVLHSASKDVVDLEPKTFTVQVAPITVGALSPLNASAGGPGFILIVNGTGFTPTSKVLWNSSIRPTQFVSAIQLQATISASDIVLPSTAHVSVTDPAQGGATSNSAPFLITSPPSLDSWSNATVITAPHFTDIVDTTGATTDVTDPTPPCGGTLSQRAKSVWYKYTPPTRGDITIDTFGSSYDTVLSVWTGSPTTDFTSVACNDDASPPSVRESRVQILNAAAGVELSIMISAFGTPSNPATGGTLRLTLSGTNPFPQIVSISPSSVLAGSPGFNLVVLGSEFVQGAKIQWNGNFSLILRDAQFISSNQLEVSIPANDVAAPDNVSVRVINPKTGGPDLISNNKTLLVVPRARVLSVTSLNPSHGVNVTVAPVDNNNQSQGSTTFNLTYNEGTQVTLTALSAVSSNNFSSWTGCDSTSGFICTVTMNADHTVTAVYATPVVTRILTVNSTNPSSGVGITVTPADNNGQGSGSTPFTRTYNQGTTPVCVTAPQTAPNSNTFQEWQQDGVRVALNLQHCLTMDADHTVTAVYATPVVTRILTVNSTNPSSGVQIAVSPTDNNGQGNGSTPFSRTYNEGTTVTLTAPPTAGVNDFSRWIGCSPTTGTSCTITVAGDQTVTAIYNTPTWTLTVASLNPASGVQITVNFADNNLQRNGTTQFTRTYNRGIPPVTLVAPSTASGNNFSSWSGCDSVADTTCTVTMQADHTVTANYVTLISVGLNASTLYFTASVGQASPMPHGVTAQEALGRQVAWTATTNVPWPTASPAIGNTPGMISVAVNLSGLSAGTHTGQLVVSSPTNAFLPVAAEIRLTLNPGVVGNADQSVPATQNRVDGYDLIRLMRAFGSRPGDANWDPAVNFADTDSNGNSVIDPNEMIIDGSDLTQLAGNFGR